MTLNSSISQLQDLTGYCVNINEIFTALCLAPHLVDGSIIAIYGVFISLIAQFRLTKESDAVCAKLSPDYVFGLFRGEKRDFPLMP